MDTRWVIELFQKKSQFHDNFCFDILTGVVRKNWKMKLKLGMRMFFKSEILIQYEKITYI